MDPSNANRKPVIVGLLLTSLRERYERMLRAALDAHAAATDGESKAEDKYDTRGLEASYLAAGQAEQVEELALSISTFELLLANASSFVGIAGPGALVEVDFGGERVFYLLAARAGGLSSEFEGCEVTVLAPDAPLRRKLNGLGEGARIQDPRLTVMSVC
jgi:hypothetical protein